MFLKDKNSGNDKGMISKERLRPLSEVAISFDNIFAFEPVRKIFLLIVSYNRRMYFSHSGIS